MKKISVLVLALVFVLSMSVVAFAADFSNPDGKVFNVDIQAKGGMPTVANGAGADDANDNSVVNANKTGTKVGGDVASFAYTINSDNMTWKDAKTGALNTNATQRTHGEYQNNTNSCASCHQTHTAAAKDLLFKNSVYNTCTACHDGTLGFYNVFATGAAASSAGTFGGTSAGNGSMHLASGAVEIKAAPGGNSTPDADEHAWNEEFSCNSCHTPHGSYGDRLLHFNPNDMADVVAAEGGNKVVSQVYAGVGALPAAVADKTYVVQDSYANIVALGFTGSYSTNNALQNGSASAAVKAATNLIVVVTGVTNSTTGITSWKVDTTPWFYEYEFDAAHANRYYSATFWVQDIASLKNGKYPVLNTTDASKDDLYSAGKLMAYQPSTSSSATGMRFDFNNAFAWGSLTQDLGKSTDAFYNASAQLKTAAIGRVIIGKVPVVYDKLDSVSGFTYGATQVNFYDKSSYGSATNGTSTIAKGTGVQLSKFCAACHTDYFNNSGTETGMFDGAFRHTTTSDSYMCLRCHFAHGTDVTIMTDSLRRGLYKTGEDGQTAVALFGGDVAKATAYLLDQNPSSALKRYTNMAVCWRCHTSSHSAGFRNTDYFKSIGYTGGSTNTTTVIPNGF